jgi:hypothetical protein
MPRGTEGTLLYFIVTKWLSYSLNEYDHPHELVGLTPTSFARGAETNSQFHVNLLFLIRASTVDDQVEALVVDHCFTFI